MIEIFLARYAPGLCVALALVVGLATAGRVAYDHGVAAEKARWVKLQAKADKAADDKLYELNTRVADTQAVLDLKIAYIRGMEKENANEKARSSDLQSQLADGSRRLSVLVHVAASQAAAAQTPAGAGAAAVDPATSTTADLDPAVASGLVGITAEGDSAIRRLNACIQAYDAAYSASNAP